MFLKHFGE